MEIRSVLVVGYNTRPVVFSAKRLGMKVYSVDHYGSLDLADNSDYCLSILEEYQDESDGIFNDRFEVKKLNELTLRVLEKYEVDGIIPTSGCDLEFLESLGIKILGNNYSKVKDVHNKYLLIKKLSKWGFNVPNTIKIEKNQDVSPILDELGTFLIKPIYGSGGKGCRLIKSHTDKIVEDDCIAQEYISGIHASVSLISNGKEAVSLSINEQILGSRFLGRTQPFRYCGNITPLDIKDSDKIAQDACEIIEKLGLVGSVGIDFVWDGSNYWFVEVNPRIQGSLECVERAYNLNLIKLHLDSLKGDLPSLKKNTKYSVKMIVFSKYRGKVSRNLYREGIYDVPNVGRKIEKGEPIVTIVADGNTREEAIKNANFLVNYVYGSIIPS